MSLFDRAYWLRIAQNPVVAAGLAIDLAPALMVVFAGWGAAALVMLYWVENLMIGVATIARILLTAIGRMGAPGLLFGGFITAFFALHYGLFCLGHGVFLLSFLLFGIGGNLITQLVGFVYQDFVCISSFTNLERHSAKRFCIQLARFL